MTAELDDVIADWAATRTAESLLAHLEQHGVPAGRLYRAPEQNVAPRLSQTLGSVRWPGRGHDQHHAE